MQQLLFIFSHLQLTPLWSQQSSTSRLNTLLTQIIYTQQSSILFSVIYSIQVAFFDELNWVLTVA